MKLSNYLTLPLLAALVAQGVSAQGDAAQAEQEIRLKQQIKELEDQLAVARAEGLRSVTVNGVELSPQHVRREAVFLVGAKLVEAKMADFFVDEWMKRAIEEGRDPKEFEISPETLADSLKNQVAEFQVKNPGVPFWEAVRALTGFTQEAYTQHWRKTELFKKVFFPGPAQNWPSITKEAIMASAGNNGGQQFWENIEKNSTDPETGEPRELPAFWMQLCQGWVQKQLKKWSDIRYPSDGLSAEVVLSVNGREWGTDEAFEFIRPALFLPDIERAMMELVVREALKQELVASESYMTDEEFREAFDDYRQEFDNTPFTTEVIATAFKGYPSLEAFRQRWRLMRSFEKMIESDVNDENLAAHAKKYARFFADGQTNVEYIQFLARNVKTGAWEPNGFAGAKERAMAAFEEIKGGADFNTVRESRGEFYVTDEPKGRLGSKSLNQIRQLIRENEFTDLLMGYSLGNFLFYDAEPGTITEPMRGAEGYYIARVVARSPARGEPSVQNPRQRELIRQDYVTQRFMEWANGVVSRATVQ